MAEGTQKQSNKKAPTRVASTHEPHTAPSLEEQAEKAGLPDAQESSAVTAPERTKEMEKAQGSITAEGEKAAENVAQAVAERATQAAIGSGLTGIAARERMRAARNADTQAGATTTPEGGERQSYTPEHREAARGSYVALHAMVRDGKSVHPGDSLTFRPDEGQHVLDLLASGTIVKGDDKKSAARALAQADLARAEAVQGSGLGGA